MRPLRAFAPLSVLLTCLALAPAAAAQQSEEPSGEPVSSDLVPVTLHTSKGAIHLELDRGRAPETVENFLRYAEEGHYDGTIFHRVIPGFMIQGGGFTTEMEQKPTHDPIPNEADNGLGNLRGTVAMARTSRPHSATSQFFINVEDNTQLDHRGKTARGWGYAVFGEVVEGMEVVDAIAGVETTSRGGHRNVPVEPVVIESVEVEGASEGG